MAKKKVDRKKPMTEQEVALVVQEAETTTQGLAPICKSLEKLNMNREENYETIMEQGRIVREIERQVVEKQKWTIAPLDEAKKRIKSLFKPMLNSCVEVRELVNIKQSEFFQIQDRKQQAEQEKLDKEAAAEETRQRKNLRAKGRRAEKRGDLRAAGIYSAEADHVEVESAVAEKHETPKVSGVAVAKIWDFEIEDIPAVPQWLELSDGRKFVLWRKNFAREALLSARKACEELEMTPEEISDAILGVRFFQKDSTRFGRL